MPSLFEQADARNVLILPLLGSRKAEAPDGPSAHFKEEPASSGPLSPGRKRVTLFCGHYGSGKTNIAVNYALYLRRLGRAVSIGDLDIVNPYFRTRDSEDELTRAGVRVISLPFANSSVDLPSLPPEANRLVQNRSEDAVLDIGGDDRGALALGRYRPYILEEDCFDMLLVVNFMRPLTRTAKDAAEVLLEIQEAARIPFTGIVNNTNLAGETTPEIVLSGQQEASQLSRLTGLPLYMTAVHDSLYDTLKGEVPDLFPLRLQPKY